MKRFHIKGFLYLLLASVIVTSCKKEDDERPVITLNGADTMYVGVNTKYIEYGASAVDNEDGNLVPLIEGLVNTNSVKTYKIGYSVADKAGNSAAKYRFVYVKNLIDVLAGTYQAHKVGFDTLTGLATDSVDYNQVVGFSTTINGRLTFTKFGNITFAPSSTKINVDVNGSSITIPQQNANIISVKHYYRGFGTVSSNNSMQITYFDSLPNRIAKKNTINMTR